MQKDSRIIAAILAADVVEYSRLMAADEPGTLVTLKARRAHSASWFPSSTAASSAASATA